MSRGIWILGAVGLAGLVWMSLPDNSTNADGGGSANSLAVKTASAGEAPQPAVGNPFGVRADVELPAAEDNLPARPVMKRLRPAPRHLQMPANVKSLAIPPAVSSTAKLPGLKPAAFEQDGNAGRAPILQLGADVPARSAPVDPFDALFGTPGTQPESPVTATTSTGDADTQPSAVDGPFGETPNFNLPTRDLPPNPGRKTTPAATESPVPRRPVVDNPFDPRPAGMPAARKPRPIASDTQPADSLPLPTQYELPPPTAVSESAAPVTEQPVKQMPVVTPKQEELPKVAAPAPANGSPKVVDIDFPVSAQHLPAPSAGPTECAVSVEWVKKTEINVGQPARCDLVVKNNAATPLHDVVVQAHFPPTLRFLRDTTPLPVSRETHLAWELKTLAAGEVRTIELHFMPDQRGALNAAAFARYTSGTAAVFEVAEPLLKVELKGPTEVQVGDPATQMIAVTNPGTGTAQNVDIKVTVPAGLQHSQGHELAMSIGAINPGETRMVRLPLAAVRGGNHVVQCVAEARLTPQAAPYLRAVGETKLSVVAPSVHVKIDGPALRYKGRNGQFVVTVQNDGTAVSNNVRVVHQLPAGFKFITADAGGQHDAVGRTTAWYVGRIAPGETVALNLMLQATELGPQKHQVSALADNGTRSEAELLTKVDGVAALVMDVSDLADPVEVGSETGYEILVRNEGTKAARNVTVACEIPEGVELVDATGPSKANKGQDLVVYESLAEIPPGKTVKYRVMVRGKRDGYHRFRARLASESIHEPLLVEELTRHYGE